MKKCFKLTLKIFYGPLYSLRVLVIILNEHPIKLARFVNFICIGFLFLFYILYMFYRVLLSSMLIRRKKLLQRGITHQEYIIIYLLRDV